MFIVKLNATDSTNEYLKSLMCSKEVEDFTVVWANKQYKGRGQMGTVWVSDPGKNLTFSVLKRLNNLNIQDQFLLNISVSLAIIKVLKAISIPDLSIKWPNDIMSGTTKICGILIENTLLGDQIQTSVIGIGLNVNQLEFNMLKNVSSLKLLLGKTLNLEELLFAIVKELKFNFSLLKEHQKNDLWAKYKQNLFRRNKPSTFNDINGDFFMGFIKDVSLQGKLIVELEDAVLKEFDLKELRLMY